MKRMVFLICILFLAVFWSCNTDATNPEEGDFLLKITVIGVGGITDPENDIQLLAGSDKVITFIPDSGYCVDSVWLDGTYVTSKNSYVITNINADHELSVKYKVGNSDDDNLRDTVLSIIDSNVVVNAMLDISEVGENRTGLEFVKFMSGTQGVDTLYPGDVIVTGITDKTPNGFLRRIISKSTTGDTITFQTQAASLDEAFKLSDVKDTLIIIDDQLIFETEAIRTDGIKVSQNRIKSRSGKYITLFTVEINKILYDYDKDFETTNDQVRVVGKYEQYCQPFMELEAGLFKGVEKCEFGIRDSVVSSIKIEAEAGFSVDTTIAILKAKTVPITVPVGFPLTISGEAGLDLHVTGDGKVEFQWGIKSTLTDTIGLEYNNEAKKFQKIPAVPKQTTVTTDQFFAGELSTRVGLRPWVGFKLYEAIGPRVGAEVYGEVKVGASATTNSASINYATYLGLDAYFSGEVKVFNITLAKFEELYNLLEYNIAKDTIKIDLSEIEGLHASLAVNGNALSWNKKDGIGKYAVYRSTSPNVDDGDLYTYTKSLTFLDTAVTRGEKYFYRVVACFGVFKSPLSNEVSLIAGAPKVTSQISNSAFVSGVEASLTFSAVGEDMNIVWYKNNIAVDSGSAILTFTPSINDNGASVKAVVSNIAGADTTNSVVLNVTEEQIKPILSALPSNLNLMSGDKVEMSITATGTNPLSYQWFKNGNPINGATSASISLPVTISDNNSLIHCVVTNPVGSTVSNKTTVYVSTTEIAPKINTILGDVTVVEGATTTFSLDNVEGTNLTYQWKLNGNNAGTNTNSFTVNASKSYNGATVQCVVSNSLGTASSRIATITVTEDIPDFSTGSASASTSSLKVGGSVTFTVSGVTGSGNYKFEWFFNSASSSWKTGNPVTLANAQTINSGGYKCKVTDLSTNKYGYTNVVTISVTEDTPDFSAGTLNLSSSSIKEGDNVTFSVSGTSGSGSYSYQWHQNGALWKTTSTNSVTLNGAKKSDAGDYKCLVTDTKSNENSFTNAVSLSVNSNIIAPKITTHPQSQTISEGNSVTFTIVATGTDLKYRWLKNGAALPGGQNATYTYASVPASWDGAKFTCKVSNSLDTIVSKEAILKVTTSISKPVFTSPTSNQTKTVTEGEGFTFNVSASGNNVSYQWQVKSPTGAWKNNDVTTAGLIGSTSIIQMDNYQFRCIASNSAGADTSYVFTLRVEEKNIAFPATILTSKSSSSKYGTTDNAFAKSNSGQDLEGQCTWYVYGRVIELADKGHIPSSAKTNIRNALWGKTGRHANKWHTFLTGNWIETDNAVLPESKRKKGLIVQWRYNTTAYPYGHVAFVESVSEDKKTYTISEYNYAKTEAYDTKTFYFNYKEGPSDERQGVYPHFVDPSNPSGW